MSTAPEEKALSLRVRLPYLTEAEFIQRYGRNVARGGIFLATRSVKPEGTRLAFELVLADGSRVMRGLGTVVKAQPDGQGSRAGMTVRFVSLDLYSRALVDAILDRRKNATGHTPPPVNDISAAPVEEIIDPEERVDDVPVAVPEPVPVAVLNSPIDAFAALPFDPPPPEADVPNPLDLHRHLTFEAGALTDEPVTPTTQLRPAVPAGNPPVPEDESPPEFGVPEAVVAGVLLEEEQGPEDTLEAADVEELGPEPITQSFKVEARSDAPAADTADVTLGLYLDGYHAICARVAASRLEALPLHGDAAALPIDIKLNALGKLELTYTPGAHPSALLRDALPLLGKRRDHPLLKDRLDFGATPLLLAGTGEPDLVWQGQTFNAQALAVTAMRAVKAQAEERGNRSYAKVMLAVPLSLGDAERRAWKTAASLAGFSVAGMVNVSSAVALSYAHQRNLARKRVLCVHMDPISIELAVAEITGEDAEIVFSLGDTLTDADVMGAVEWFTPKMRAALEKQGLALAKMDAVVFSGALFERHGVRDRVEYLLGAMATDFDEASEAPALGAALWGESRAQFAHGDKGLSLSDISPTCVDVAVTPGGTERAFERGTRLPTEKVFSHRLREAQELEVAVFEGSESRFVGLARLRAERSGEVTVKLTATPDGLLEWTAELPGGKSIPLTLTANEAPQTDPRQPAAPDPQPAGGLLGGLTRIFRRR